MAIQNLNYNPQFLQATNPYYGSNQNKGIVDQYQGMPTTTATVQPSYKQISAEDINRVLEAQEKGILFTPESEINPFLPVGDNKDLEVVRNMYQGDGEYHPSIEEADFRDTDSQFYEKYPEGLVA